MLGSSLGEQFEISFICDGVDLFVYPEILVPLLKQPQRGCDLI
jgi:hypothetical protein